MAYSTEAQRGFNGSLVRGGVKEDERTEEINDEENRINIRKI